MTKKVLLSALAAGAVAATGPALAIDKQETPADLLPAVISRAFPVRVVSTALDRTGRPVVTVRTATDRASAVRLVVDGQRAAGAAGVELDVPVRAAGTDTYRDRQWDLDAIRVAEAWPRATGSGVTVAVLDSGVDSAHPDLSGQVLPGADFITGTEGPGTDPNGHGTHVAGTIAALTGNGRGVAGVAPDARILPVRVLGANGGGYMSDVASGIVYAADHGADVINMSVSATSQVGAVTDAIAYARSRGVVVVAAAGNARGNGSPTAWPAADTGVLAVAATDAGDRVAPYSNRGGYVDVAAPGSDIMSTVPGGGYRPMNGTSMAAPHVAALAALLKSADRGLTPDRIEQAIESSAADLGDPGRDDDFGHGRIDAAAALNAAVPPPAPATEQPAPTEEQPAADPTAPTEGQPTPEPSAPPSDQPTPSDQPSDQPTPGDQPDTEPAPADQPTTEPAPADQPAAGDRPTPGAGTPSTPAPAAPITAPTPPAPAGKLPLIAYAVRTGTQQLTVAMDGVDSQVVELQWQTAAGWQPIFTFPAVRAARLNGLPLGATYRIVVPESVRYAGAVSASVRF